VIRAEALLASDDPVTLDGVAARASLSEAVRDLRSAVDPPPG
jgi:hypothetical protein